MQSEPACQRTAVSGERLRVTCSRADCALDEQGVCKALLCMAADPGMLAALCGVLAAGKLLCGVPAKPSPADHLSM